MSKHHYSLLPLAVPLGTQSLSHSCILSRRRKQVHVQLNLLYTQAFFFSFYFVGKIGEKIRFTKTNG